MRSPGEVRLRRMTAGDVPAVLRLEHRLFPEDAWSEEMFLGELGDQPRTRHYVVAIEEGGTEEGGTEEGGTEEGGTEGGRVVGYAGLAAAGDQADVQTLGVHPGRQGAGIGAALLTELLDEAARRGGAEVFLEVRADNDRAQRLYERFGFERVGVRKRYYEPSGMDAIVMRRRRPAAAAARRRPIGFFWREDQKP